MAVQRWINDNWGDFDEPVQEAPPGMDDSLLPLTSEPANIVEAEADGLTSAGQNERADGLSSAGQNEQADGFTSVGQNGQGQNDRPPKLRRLVAFCISPEKAEQQRVRDLEQELHEWKKRKAQLRLQLMAERLLLSHYVDSLYVVQEWARNRAGNR
ncbi:unnamed protein product [Symbiodinium sp. CCMP2592]|nr:unnamed protein product [Symbiodinium sp. CCMP2592]